MNSVIKNNPLVSVIIPVFNSERYLEQSLNSVIKQDYKHIEILVIDGNSTDRTENICKNFSMINFHKQKGKGISDALNYGIEISNGEFISFISSDDLWMPEKLGTQIKLMTINPEIKYTITKVKFFLEPGCKLPKKFNKKFLEGSYIQYILENLVARRSLFDQVGMFDNFFSCGMEIDWFARAKDKNIEHSVLDEVLVYKRVHNQNTTLNTANPLNQQVRAMYNSILRKKNYSKS